MLFFAYILCCISSVTSDTEHKLDNIETSVQCKLEEYNLLNMDIIHIKTEAECCITWLNQCQESIGDKPTAWNNAVEVNLKLEGLTVRWTNDCKMYSYLYISVQCGLLCRVIKDIFRKFGVYLISNTICPSNSRVKISPKKKKS